MKFFFYLFIIYKYIILNLYFYDFVVLFKSFLYICNKYDKLFYNNEKKFFILERKILKNWVKYVIF